MTEQQRVSPAMEALCIAIGLSQAQFASDGLDGGALIAAIDTYTEAVTADARAEMARLRELADKWEREQATYPKDSDAGTYASAAVRACIRELRAALGGPDA